MLQLSEWAQGWWFIILLGFGIARYVFSPAKRRSKRFADWLDATALKLPILGSVMHDAVIARFSTTFAAGVPLVVALESTAGPRVMCSTRALRRIRDDVTAGTSLALAIRTTGLFPTMLIQMTAIGEESGSLNDMLSKVANHFEAAVDNVVDSLSS